MDRRLDNLRGKSFGFLKVVKRSVFIKNTNRTFWLCKCKCGNKITVKSENLKNNNTTSCGCVKRTYTNVFIDLKGKTFGKLKVLCKVGSTKGRSALWLCKCECGKEKAIASGNLRWAGTKSCGCSKRDGSLVRPLGKNTAAKNSVLHSYQKGAKKRGLTWKLSKKLFLVLIQKKCKYCGGPPSNVKKINNNIFTHNGIDRVDSSVGYIKENVVPCCRICNNAKSYMNIDDFISWINRLKKHKVTI